MKQIDAGLYTVSDIDDQIDRLHQQTAYLVDLLQKNIEPNDLVNNEWDKHKGNWNPRSSRI